MKHTLLSICMLALTMFASAQQTTVTWDYDGNARKYIQYVPPVYDGSEAVPLILALHGLGDNVNNFQGVGFQLVADTANFIVVYPEALPDPFTGGNAWNSGAGISGISLNANIDDVGFLNAVIDSISENFNIDQNRIYATGFSMGGFMSNRLACELNNRISSIASVAGTVGGVLTCNPGTELPVCHIHGTSDTNVGYGTPEGAQDNTFGQNVSEWISFWTSNNGCGNVTLEGQFPNTANDGYTVEYVEYGGCSGGNRVVHYKVNGADHVWLPDNQSGNDVFYILEIWKFFLGLSPDNVVPASVGQTSIETIGLYPNPTADVLRLENIDSKILNISIFNTTGQLVKDVPAVTNTIDVSDLKQGLYQLMVATEDGIYSNSFVKE